MNKMNFEILNQLDEMKKANKEIYVDAKTNMVVDHWNIKDKSKLIRLNSAKRQELMER